MRRLLSYRAALPSLMALCLAGCGAAPAGPGQAALPPDTAAATASGIPPLPQGQLLINPSPQSTSSRGFLPGSKPASSAAGIATGTLVPAIFDRPDAGETLIPFASNRLDGGGNGSFDLYIYDRASGTVLALPAVNTPLDELYPRLSHNGRWMVYQTNASGVGTFDIYLFNLENQTINTLATLNTPFNEFEPSVDDSGSIIAFSCDQPGYDQLRLHYLPTGQTIIPAALATYVQDAHNPEVSGDGRVVAFWGRGQVGGSDIFALDVPTGQFLSYPFVNSPFDETDPCLSADGRSLAFSSNRTGDNDVFVADLATGYIDHLAPANSVFNENAPRFLGAGNNQVLFQSDRDGLQRLYVYQRDAGMLDTLPITNFSISDNLTSDRSSAVGSLWGGIGTGLGVRWGGHYGAKGGYLY